MRYALPKNIAKNIRTKVSTRRIIGTMIFGICRSYPYRRRIIIEEKKIEIIADPKEITGPDIFLGPHLMQGSMMYSDTGKSQFA